MKRKILVMLLGLVMICQAVACGKTEEETGVEETVAADENNLVDGEMNENNQEVLEDISDREMPLTLILDGKELEMPINFDELEEEGWVCDLSQKDMESYTLAAGEHFPSLFRIENEKYGDGLLVEVKFVNLDETEKDILDCEIYEFGISTMNMYKLIDVENYPSVEIVGGIQMGSSVEEVEAVFGNCDNVLDLSDTSIPYVQYVYWDDRQTSFTFDIFEDGLRNISIDLNPYQL